jgi:hypothetical protein
MQACQHYAPERVLPQYVAASLMFSSLLRDLELRI